MAARDINAFMAAVRALESGGGDPRGNYSAENRRTGAYGAYQIMPQYWAGWAREAGVAGASIRDPKMQDIVARHRMMKLYARYGRFDYVAGAWFAGEGGLNRFLREGRDASDGNMRVSEYMEQIRTNIPRFGGEAQSTGGALAADAARRGEVPSSAASLPTISASLPTRGAGRLFPSAELDQPTFTGSEDDFPHAGEMLEGMLLNVSRAMTRGQVDEQTDLNSLIEQGGEVIDPSLADNTPETVLDLGEDMAEGAGSDPFGRAVEGAAQTLMGSGLHVSLGDLQDAVSEIADMPLFDTSSGASGAAGEVLDYAKQFIGTPYVWGGTTPNGFDCSGLVQYVFRQAGVNLPRVSADQAKAGTAVKDVASARPGDLVFWRGSNGNPNHIGIYVGDGKMLEAPRTGLNVRIRDISSAPHAIRRVI